MHSTLIQDIQNEKNRLTKIITSIPASNRTLKILDGTGGKVSVTDLLAYQIGWGKNLIRWYESGIKGKKQEMPGDGFSKWDYVAIAKFFYQKYLYDSSNQQIEIFHQVVSRILEIIEIEQQTDQLDQIGIWSWCTLSSGKQWPLSKWIRVNTVSPYKRAAQLIKKMYPAKAKNL